MVLRLDDLAGLGLVRLRGWARRLPRAAVGPGVRGPLALTRHGGGSGSLRGVTVHSANTACDGRSSSSGGGKKARAR